MEKKSMKKVTRIAVAFLAVIMVLVLSGCEKLEDKFVKEMEAKVEKLETAAKAADSEGFDQINKEILSMRTNQEYAKLNADPDNSFSESNKNKISSLANRVEASRSELSTNVFIKNLDKLTTDLEAAITSQDSYNYAKLLCVDGQNLEWENIDQNEPVLLQPLERFRATLSAEMHYTLPEYCLKFDLNSAGTGVIITGLQNWEQEFDYLFLDIPATIQGLPVKEIQNPSANRGWDDYGDREKNHYSVFYCSCRGISIPNGIEEIGIDAFSDFEGSTVQLPASLKKISG